MLFSYFEVSQPGLGMPPSSQPNGNAVGDRFRHNLVRTQIRIALAYSYDCLMLFGFAAAGYISLQLPIAILASLTFLVVIVNVAHASGWSRKQQDPTLFLPQQFYAICVALSVAVIAPQIGFQPFATLFAISAFSFLAPNTKSLVYCWVATAIGAVAVIFLAGPRLAMPTSSLAGQALTAGVLIGLLARCIWIATFFQRLRRRLSQKNRELKAAISRIEILANRDPLTGLPNRRAVTSWLDEQIALCRRSKAPLSVAILDIDHFKRINDAHGHAAGDRTLQIFAGLASDSILDTDRIGRYGGEEFLVVLCGTDLRAASAPLERVRERLATQDWAAIDRNLHVTITIGVTEYIAGDTADTLIRRADMALYFGKEAGRDRVVLSPIPLRSASFGTTPHVPRDRREGGLDREPDYDQPHTGRLILRH
jgi:diguanylate cyclase